MGELIMLPSGKHTKTIQKTMERSTIFNGKIHYLTMVIFNSYVKLPEGISCQLPNGRYLWVGSTWFHLNRWRWPTVLIGQFFPGTFEDCDVDFGPTADVPRQRDGSTSPFFGNNSQAVSTLGY